MSYKYSICTLTSFRLNTSRAKLLFLRAIKAKEPCSVEGSIIPGQGLTDTFLLNTCIWEIFKYLVLLFPAKKTSRHLPSGGRPIATCTGIIQNFKCAWFRQLNWKQLILDSQVHKFGYFENLGFYKNKADLRMAVKFKRSARQWGLLSSILNWKGTVSQLSEISGLDSLIILNNSRKTWDYCNPEK